MVRVPWRDRVLVASAAGMCAVLAISGCGSSDKSKAEATGPLNVWVRGANDSIKAYQKVFDAFTAKTGIQIKPFMTLTDFETKLSAAATSHKLPDVVVDDAAQLGNFETQGIIQPVDKSAVAGQDQLTDRAWDSAKDLTGKYYAVPFSAQANILLVRSDWLAKLKLQPPKTWQDVATVAKAFTTQDPDGDGKADTYGLDVPGSTTRGYISWYWSSLLWEAGGSYFKPAGNGKFAANLDTPQATQSVQWFEDQFCTNKVVQPSALNDTTTEANKAFQTGVTGMYFTGPYAYATMDATAIKGKYVAVAPPAGPANGQTLAEGTDIYLMAGGKTSEAKKLAEFMITPEAQRLGMTAVPTATIVRLPVNKTVDAATEHQGDDRWKLAQQVYQSDGHYEDINMPNWTALRQATSDGLNALVAKCGDPATALHTLNDKLNSILKTQGVAAG
ncbi:sugar ABC transporter substrate-binding protein [Rugosimonospora africana]|uniref:Sugar ABC transporter substrate-binding protein n=1 Tax=Rugosimonospora africana TaxID=556532 RepID=A0A8J3QNW5_9ACTN|nr:sugar ABC transporter substrate-binding protein [Rugosimonospora africana]GIH14655.1 sugar ABC transporter substrate-binding protein [Rugosimonospora africana]